MIDNTRKPDDNEDDPNQTAKKLVDEVTGQDEVNGEDLLENPKLKEALRKAKEREKESN